MRSEACHHGDRAEIIHSNLLILGAGQGWRDGGDFNVLAVTILMRRRRKGGRLIYKYIYVDIFIGNWEFLNILVLLTFSNIK